MSGNGPSARCVAAPTNVQFEGAPQQARQESDTCREPELRVLNRKLGRTRGADAQSLHGVMGWLALGGGEGLIGLGVGEEWP